MKSILLSTHRMLVVAVLACASHASGDSPEPDLRIDLESYWPMDGKLDDWLTGAAGVVAGGSSVRFGPGVGVGALIADVPGGSIALAHRVTPAGGALSVSLWITPFALGVPGQTLLQDGAAWRLHRNAATDELAISAAGATLVLPGDWENGGWHHIAFTVRSGGALTVRVDGAPRGVTVAGTLLAGSGLIRVGADPAHPGDSVGVCLDEVALWTRELSATELECLDAPVGGDLASLLGPAPEDYVLATLTLVRDPAPRAMLSWQVPAGTIDLYNIQTSNDLIHWSVLGTAENHYSDPIPATPDAKRFYRVFRKIWK